MVERVGDSLLLNLRRLCNMFIELRAPSRAPMQRRVQKLPHLLSKNIPQKIINNKF